MLKKDNFSPLGYGKCYKKIEDSEQKYSINREGASFGYNTLVSDIELYQ